MGKTYRDKNDIIIYDDYAEVILRDIQCEVTAIVKIDKEDVEFVKEYHWHMNHKGYAVRPSRFGSPQAMHRLLIGANKGEIVDHINRDRQDNRKYNLRIVTALENSKNVGMYSNNKTGVKGISKRTDYDAYCVKVKHDKKVFTKTCKTFEEALIVLSELEEKAYGKPRIQTHENLCLPE